MSAAKRGPSGSLGFTRMWVVEPGPRFSLGDVLRRLGYARGALDDGRVFVDGRRVLDARLRLEAGQRVELHPARRGGGEASLLDERDGLVVALKPPGLPTEPDHHGLGSLRADVAEALGAPESALHAVSRLDVGVSGVVLFACTRAARRHVESVRKRGELRRRYVGIVERPPEPLGGSWDQAIATAPRGRARVAGRGAGGLPAETRYIVLGQVETPLRSVGRHAREVGPALVAFEPVTGRTHQIRVHAANARVPLLGDRLYGGALSLVLPDGQVLEAPRIALHAAWVELPDLHGHLWRVQAPRPPDLLRFWRDLGAPVEPWESGDDDQDPGCAARVE